MIETAAPLSFRAMTDVQFSNNETIFKFYDLNSYSIHSVNLRSQFIELRVCSAKVVNHITTFKQCKYNALEL